MINREICCARKPSIDGIDYEKLISIKHQTTCFCVQNNLCLIPKINISPVLRTKFVSGTALISIHKGIPWFYSET
jgi:hypothetical protein